MRFGAVRAAHWPTSESRACPAALVTPVRSTICGNLTEAIRGSGRWIGPRNSDRPPSAVRAVFGPARRRVRSRRDLFFERVLVDLLQIEGLPYLNADVVPDHQLGQLLAVDEP